MSRPVGRTLAVRARLLVAFLALALLPLAAPAAAAEAEPKNDLERAYQELTKVSLDASSGASLKDFQLRRDCLEITFGEGTLYLAKPIAGKVTGAAFVGSGRIKMEPPDRIEKEQLKKRLDAEVVDQPFTAAFFRFNDGTEELFQPLLQGGGGGDSSRAGGVFEEREKALNNLKQNVEFSLLQHRLSGAPFGNLFFGEFETKEKGWISFFLNPDAEEEVALFQHTKAGVLGDTRDADIWCSFDRLEERGQPESLRYKQDKDLLALDKITMDLKIQPKTLLLDNDVRLDLTSRIDGLALVRLDFIHEGIFGHPGKVSISSLTDGAGKELQYVHKNHQLLVRLERPLNKGEKEDLRCRYTGDIIAPIFILGEAAVTPGNSIPPELDFLPSHPVSYQLLNTYPWFPQYGYLRRSAIDWTVRVPRPNLPVVSGDALRTWDEGEYSCIQVAYEIPVILPSIIFGEYYLVSSKDLPPPGSGGGPAGDAGEGGEEGEERAATSAQGGAEAALPVINVYSLAKQKGERRKILDETMQIVRYYQSLWGPYPYRELDIVQMSFFFGFGQAPPGLVQLTGEAFLTEEQIARIQTVGNPAFRSAFLAHEVAHQWWAHVVAWRTYHDQWLSEAFAEYSSGMYMGVLEGNEGFRKKLDDWREDAMQVKDAGPISLGARLDKDYINTTYAKGPYVVHMLRMSLVSQFGPDEGTTKFVEALRKFLETYEHQNPTTTDLQQVVSRSVGLDMDWFFDQWYRGSGVPKLHFTYDVRQTEDGKWLLEGRIRQDDPQNSVKMVMPVYYDFGREKFSEQKLWVDRPDFTFKAKLPAEPKKVELNKTGEVLAEIVGG